MKEIKQRVRDLQAYVGNLQANVTNVINAKHQLLDPEVRALGINAYVEKQTELIREGLAAIKDLADFGRSDLDKLGVPDTRLPFVTYGAFKPGQLAFSQIKHLLDRERPPELIRLKGVLLVRDGLPLWAPGTDLIEGYALHFAREHAGKAYGVIRKFEPAEIYEWTTVDLSGTVGQANALKGRSVDHGNPAQLNKHNWTFSDDPVFSEGLTEIAGIIERDCDHLVQESHKRAFEWARFFRLQMAYLLLWSAIERFTCFAYGPRLNDYDRNQQLAKDQRFATALQQVRPRLRTVSQSLRPEIHYRLDPGSPEDALRYYYQVRCNLTHRGKANHFDLETLDSSLWELCQIFKGVLDATKAEEQGYEERA